MKRLSKAVIATLACAALPSAYADLISIEVLPDGGATPASIGGFDLTSFSQPAVPAEGCDAWGDGSSDGVTSTGDAATGIVEFVESDGVTPLCMSVQDPDWWEWDHGNVFTTHVNWVELIMPEDTRAFTLFVGAVSGRGWIEGKDGDGDTVRQYFGGDSGVDFGFGETPGFGVFVGDGCASIERIVIEPWEWGTGNFAINRGSCETALLPDPAPITLLGLGLLGMAIARRRLSRRKTDV